MRLHVTPVVSASAICVSILAASSSPATAAPDQTQGAAVMSARVAEIGTLLGGAGVVSAERAATGFYHVTFDRSVDGCTSVVSIGSPDSFIPQGIASASGPSTGDNIVSVLTLDTSGVKADRRFMLIVSCAQRGDRRHEPRQLAGNRCA